MEKRKRNEMKKKNLRGSGKVEKGKGRCEVKWDVVRAGARGGEKVECGWRAVTQTGTSGAGEGPEAVHAVWFLFWWSWSW